MHTRYRSPLFSVVLLSAAALTLPAATAETHKPAGDEGVLVLAPIAYDTSPPLSAIERPPRGAPGHPRPDHTIPPGVNQLPESWKGTPGVRHSPHVLQIDHLGLFSMPSPVVNAVGLGDDLPGFCGCFGPPDTTGDVGLSHYLQWVNVAFAFFSKSDGALVSQPGDDWFDGNTLWAGFGGPCEDANDGDPIALYDQLSDRWLLSQLAVLPTLPDGPFYQCIAVSADSDPTGSWHRYAYAWPNDYLNDYPKFGVWPDGYYLTVNQFEVGAGGFAGAGVAVFDRAAMLSGSAATAQYWNLDAQWASLLPSDLDGETPAPAGSPAYLVATSDGDLLSDYLLIWKVSVDWANPANSTCGDASNGPDASILVSPYSTIQSVPQPGTSFQLDAIGDRLMFRLAYRNFGSHESLVLNHTVDVDGHAGIRWYEIRNPGATPLLYQEGTYAPDADSRWMGSIAMDNDGNIALGYSVASSATFPSIRYAGRLAEDPLGLMPQAEVSVVSGGGSQTSDTERWGDYSTMSIDPSDDCSFWYTQEYIAADGAYNWRTRIASFKFPSCTGISDAVFSDGFESGGWDEWSAVVRTSRAAALGSGVPVSREPHAKTRIGATYTLPHFSVLGSR